MTQRQLDECLPHAAFSHVVLRTADVPATVAFYGHVLGMKVNSGGVTGAALSHDGEHHRIALIGVPPSPRRAGPGLEHVAWKAGSLGDLLANHRRIRDAGIEHYVAIHHGGTLSIYYRDPDLNQVEVFIDTMVVDEAIEYMRTPEFASNPLGVPFDPDDLIRRYEGGETIEQLLRQPKADDDAMDEMITKVIAGMTGS